MACVNRHEDKNATLPFDKKENRCKLHPVFDLDSKECCVDAGKPRD
jgi:hypothetical protein